MESKIPIRRNGFTLIEMLVTLSIIGIVIGIGANGYTDWVFRSKTVEAASSLQRSLSHARSESIKYGGNVRLCGSKDFKKCKTGFNKGWIVFHDTDNSGQVNDQERVLSVTQQVDTNLSVTIEDLDTGNSPPGITFNFKGYPNLGLSATIKKSGYTETFSMSRTGHFK